MDVLGALRDAISQQRPITFLEGTTPTTTLTAATTHIVLSPSLTVARNAPTRFKKDASSSATDPESAPGEFFTIEALLLAWTLKNAGGGDYIRQTKTKGVAGSVGITDRGRVVEWLEGKGDHPNVVGARSTTPPLPDSPSKPTSSAPASAPRREKREHPFNAADYEVCKRIKLQEIELKDRNSVLRGVKVNNFSNIKTLLASRQKPKEAVKDAPRPDAKVGAKKAKNMHPIIVIPSSPTSLITMYNVKKFLDEASFEPSEAAKSRMIREGNLKVEDVIAIVRRRTESEQPVKYYIVDSVEALSKFGQGGGGDPWDRVVCVLTTGQQWQFKPYKWSEPRQLFHNVKGMYIKWRNDTSQVKDWNVSTLEASLGSAAALWPFPSKRFQSNGLISAGELGLQGVQGRVVAFGDLNGDQFLDLLTLSEDQKKVDAWVWDHNSFSFSRSTTVASFITGQIVNVVPADLNYDGRLDMLIMTIGKEGKQLDLSLHLGDGQGVNYSSPRTLPPSGLAHPIVLDSDGNMRLNMLGLDPDGNMKLWRNNDDTSGTFTLVDPPLPSQACKLADPHSSAVVDFNGDCLADLFLHCQDDTFQIWTRSPGSQGGYTFARGEKLPKGAGAVSFADMDRDGTLDIVFPVCKSFSSKTGVGLDCSVHIAYNKQIPLCPSAGGIPSGGSKSKCRSPGDLCVADEAFGFKFDQSAGDAYSVIPLNSILPNHDSLLLTDTSHNPPLPIPLRIGDANLDGYPDILAVAVDEAGVNRVPVLLFSVPGKDGPLISANALDSRGLEFSPHVQQLFGVGRNVSTTSSGTHHRRFFKSAKRGAEALAEITDARGVAFVDLDEDGTLDILVQRNGAQTGSRIAFIQNNFFQDAFFLKAIVLNGACPSGICETSSGKYKPFGSTNPGASFKYTVLDTRGDRSAAFGTQLPQTGYQVLHTPYAFLGLGRTNNYIETLIAGSTSPQSSTTLEGVIPNSKLVLNPNADGTDWKRELFLRPGQWLWWVLFTLVAATVILLVVVMVLHINEKREDERERKKALHHINFDAL
ncbi:Cdc73 family RNA polymerase II accessory factor [Rhizoctonia solani]|uniref:Cdc73 family RNA polymerase II accessory factor n=1 Tax=Rhizoctonia solani TaxID=456999 RepID=A0A8H8P759_9AGAM|nr:Cdc73 family RNA polymerase II accessory factor [Rhizoctonia solani]QRW26836.1 Cdc73 family RNA polymerase II accessory factor [Rhizoctonia solani]